MAQHPGRSSLAQRIGSFTNALPTLHQYHYAYKDSLDDVADTKKIACKMTCRSDITSKWQKYIREVFPDLDRKSYFLPPVYISKACVKDRKIDGQSVFVQGTCNDSQHREDMARVQALGCLKTLANKKNEKEKNEVMFVFSRLQFSHYLGKQDESVLKILKFIRPKYLAAEKHKRGCFDILVIHLKYGILLGQVKSVMSNAPYLQTQKEPADLDKNIARKVSDAIKLLEKNEAVLKELVKDLMPNVNIMKFLVLPYVSGDSLRQILTADENLKTDLLKCLGAKDPAEAIKVCFLQDNMTFQDGWDVPQIQIWWDALVSNNKETSMTEDIYFNLIARFAGPATEISADYLLNKRIEMRTEADGISGVGEIMTSFVLTEKQLDLVLREPEPSRLFLNGPPGTGKTVVLVLKARGWINKGHNVHIVNTRPDTLAASYLLTYMVRGNRQEEGEIGQIYHHAFDCVNQENDHKRLVETIKQADTPGKRFYFICDDVWARKDSNELKRLLWCLYELCKISNMSIWVASSWSHVMPEQLQSEQMTIPLRNPTNIVSSISESFKWYKEEVKHYTPVDSFTPCLGPDIMHIKHEGSGHHEKEIEPIHCSACGEKVADILLKLGIGADQGTNTSDIDQEEKKETRKKRNNGKSTSSRAPALEFRDVFVLTGSPHLRDEEKDPEGSVTSPASCIVMCLRSKNIPVQVITKSSPGEVLRDMAEARSNMVTVANYFYTVGLERKVVVWMWHGGGGLDRHYSVEELDAHGRFRAVSRCTSQLIVVEVPRHSIGS